jgi:hypothetical protein
MTKYFEVLDNQFEEAGTVAIKGVPLDVDPSHPLKAKGYFPILFPTCVCVTDPCPCDGEDDLIIWLPESGVRSRKVTQLKSKRGEVLQQFQVIRDVDCVTETLSMKKAASLDRRRSVGSLEPKIPGTRIQMKVGCGTLFRSYECGGDGVQYLVIEGPDGSGGTAFEYIAIGSCTPTSS